MKQNSGAPVWHEARQMFEEGLKSALANFAELRGLQFS